MSRKVKPSLAPRARHNRELVAIDADTLKRYCTAMFVWDLPPSDQKRYRANLIKAWFENIDSFGGPGMILMSWETSMPVDEWWETILEMVRMAPNNRCLGSVAAGPLEHLLARYGVEIIDRVESQARVDEKFKQALGGVWKSSIDDEVWRRINVILK